MVERLTGLPLSIGPLNSIDDYRAYRLSEGDQLIYLSADVATQRTKVAIPIAGNSGQFVLSELVDVNQSVTRASAILVLNELGRHPKNMREEALQSLNRRFGH